MSNTADGEARILGSLREVDGKGAVRMQDRFDTDIDDLWNALTEPGRLVRWLGEVDGELRPGGQFRAHFFATGWEGAGHVHECEPTRRFLITTTEAGEPGEHVIEATLSADGGQTMLVIEERGMPLEQLAAYGAGMQVHVEDLASYLGGRERSEAQARWTELMPSYQHLATTVG